MTREKLSETITFGVLEYLNNPSGFDADPQIRINPVTLAVALSSGADRLASIEESMEADEEAAAAQRAATEDATDYQAKQNPDFYPVKELIKHLDGNRSVPDADAIKAIVNKYI